MIDRKKHCKRVVKALVRGQRRQRGVALVELLLFTVPLCVLAIVLASAIAATSSAKTKAMWKASLKAQLATREPCAGAPLLLTPTLSSKQGKFLQGYRKAVIPASIGMPITLTAYKTEKVSEAAPRFYFEQAAERMFPDRTRQAENSATFVCNEPNNGDSRRAIYDVALFGLGLAKARELF